MDFLAMFFTWGIPLLATLLAGLIATQLRAHFKISLTAKQEKVLADVLARGIAFGEEWARKQLKLGLNKPTGADKLEQVALFVRTELARLGIKLPEGQLEKLLHATLGALR